MTEEEAAITPSAWNELDRSGGVVLRAIGSGPPVVLFPGMEGSGESCLHLAGPVVLAPTGPIRGRLLLVDYAGERHRFLGELVDTITQLLDAHVGDDPVTWWGQSFGNLLLALVEPRVRASTRARVLVSPFTGLPSGRLHAAHVALSITPASVYTASTPAVARWIFGPAPGDSGDQFVAALARMSPADVRRRTGWLEGGDLAGIFLSVGAPFGVWLGERDRLIDLPRQLAFFTALTQGGGGLVSVVAGCGHVALPALAVTVIRQEIGQWLMTR